jgi:hypothetical protein
VLMRENKGKRIRNRIFGILFITCLLITDFIPALDLSLASFRNALDNSMDPMDSLPLAEHYLFVRNVSPITCPCGRVAGIYK